MKEQLLKPGRKLRVANFSGAVATAGFVAALLLATAPQAAADWLLLTDGTTVETAGPWRVKGATVIFSTPKGDLASLRLSKIDLAASTEISLSARDQLLTPPEVTTPPEPKAAFVITDDDVSHGENDTSAPEDDTAQDGTEEAAEGGLVVTGWDQRQATGDGGLIITGTMRNQASNTSAGINVSATLYDTDGVVIATEYATLNSRALSPQQRTNFRVDFADVFSFAAVNFDIESQALATPSTDREAREEEPTPEDGSDNNDIRSPNGVIAPATT